MTAVRIRFSSSRIINLNIAPGRFVSIVGLSGCGKSTLLKCIAGLQQVTAGADHGEG